MDVTISIPPDIEGKLVERAKSSGYATEDYITQLIVKDISRKSLRDIFAPVREEIAASGISEDELDALLVEARDEAFQERMARGE
ncbi:MAG: hypothetical protein HY231_20495 [Acidobacteria bacterium]|nr:hypothetical protein [Acidobacteriota bacterium]